MKKVLLFIYFFAFFAFQAIAQDNLLNKGQDERKVDSNSIWNMTMLNYIHRIDSLPAKITGGCVTMSCGSISTSLVLMALDISGRKAQNENEESEISNIISELRKKQDTLNQYAEDDNVIFQNFLAAYRLSHSTTEEERKRDSVIKVTLIGAINSPLEAAGLLHRIFTLCNVSKKLVSNNVKSDIRGSGVMLNATFTSVMALVKDNINQLPASERSTYQKKAYKLEAQQRKIYTLFISTLQ